MTTDVNTLLHRNELKDHPREFGPPFFLNFYTPLQAQEVYSYLLWYL